MGAIRVCTPRVLSIMEAARHRQSVLPPGVQSAAMLTSARWPAGQHLRVKFRGGRLADRRGVLTALATWQRSAYFTFEEVAAGPSEVRCAFDQTLGSWAVLGTQALGIDPEDATCNMGWPDDPARDLHEMGHVLGLEHEDMRPDRKLDFNKPAVYAYFGGPPNSWSPQEIDQQILDTLDPSTLTETTWDKLSIMAYAVPAELLNDPSQAVAWNQVLSELDKQLIGQMYPYPPGLNPPALASVEPSRN